MQTFKPDSSTNHSNSYREDQVKQELARIRCSIEPKSCQSFIYFLSKVTRHLVDGIYMNAYQFKDMMKSLQQDRKNRVLFVPVYKSWSDALILNYINHKYELQPAFTYSSYGDSPKMSVIDAILRNIGVLMVRNNE